MVGGSLVMDGTSKRQLGARFLCESLRKSEYSIPECVGSIRCGLHGHIPKVEDSYSGIVMEIKIFPLRAQTRFASNKL
jgi:hypothetical protein